MYKINDYVVYKHDVCKIKKIKTDDKTGQTYYVMTPIDDDSLIITIPTDIKTGLRDIISKKEAEKLIQEVKDIEPLENINDKDISFEYKELLNKGTHTDLIKIIKTSYIRNANRINNKKKISEKDDTYFNLAEKYLYNELSISLDKSTDEIIKYITEIVNE